MGKAMSRMLSATCTVLFCFVQINQIYHAICTNTTRIHFYKDYQWIHYKIRDFLFLFQLCFVHFFIDNIFPNKLSGQEILHFPLNRTSKNATAAAVRSSKVKDSPNRISMLNLHEHIMLCANKMFKSILVKLLLVRSENLLYCPNIE